MKHSIKFTIALFTLFSFATIHAQTADEIVTNYIENIGGAEAWEAVENMQVTGVGRQQGVDYPFVATYMKDGRYVIDVDLQGTSFIVEAFDGENSWAMNFQTQKAEASDSETSMNVKNGAQDEIVSPFHNYKEKGYTVELVGKDSWEGSEVFKVKLTKKPVLVDGKEEENSEIYYFDTENFVPIAAEETIKSGPAKGAIGQTLFSDYQEVDGIMFPQMMKTTGAMPMPIEMKVESIKVNPEIDEAMFTIK